MTGSAEGRGQILSFCGFWLCLLGFESLLLTFPALILQLLQLLQDTSRLVGGVDQHAKQLRAEAKHLKTSA